VTNKSLLRRLIVSIIKEEIDSDPRFATQLLDPKDAKNDKKSDSEEELNDDGDVVYDELDEFSACGSGAISGFSAPLTNKKFKKT